MTFLPGDSGHGTNSPLSAHMGAPWIALKLNVPRWFCTSSSSHSWASLWVLIPRDLAGGAESSEGILLHLLRMLSSSGDHNVVVNVP